MTKEQEIKLTEHIKKEMTRVRNDAIVTGMKSALSVILDMCNKDKEPDKKISDIKEFCEKGLYNG